MTKNRTKIKPKHLFRPMSAEEVEGLWTTLNDQYLDAKARYERCFTSDKTGILILHREECDHQQARMRWLEQARYILVDILAKGSA